jgi:hypothetical protein
MRKLIEFMAIVAIPPSADFAFWPSFLAGVLFLGMCLDGAAYQAGLPYEYGSGRDASGELRESDGDEE